MRHREDHRKMEAEISAMLPQAEEHQGLVQPSETESKRHGTVSPPETPQGNSLLILDFWPPEMRKKKKISFLKPPNLWQCIVVAPGGKITAHRSGLLRKHPNSTIPFWGI